MQSEEPVKAEGEENPPAKEEPADVEMNAEDKTTEGK